MRRVSHALLTAVIGVVVVAASFAATTVAFAAFRPQINYQGKLTDSNNLAVADGNYYMTFRLYTTATGGTPIWTEAHVGTTTPVAVTNGLFTVMLGSINSLAGVNFDQPLWLEVAIGGTNGASWETLSPRKPLGAVPAAFVAQTAQTLDNLDSTQFLRSDTSDTFGGGTLTIDGSGALSVLGGATFSNATSSTFYTTTLGVGSDYLTDITGTGLAVVGSALSVTNVPASSLTLPHGFIFRGSASSTAEATSTLYVADSGRLGIGTMNPREKLDVEGGYIKGPLAFWNNTPQRAWVITPFGTNSNNLAFRSTITNEHFMVFDPSTYYGGTDKGIKVFQDFAVAGASGGIDIPSLYVDRSAGRIGIGTTSPQFTVDIVGTQPYVRARGTSGAVGAIIRAEAAGGGWIQLESINDNYQILRSFRGSDLRLGNADDGTLLTIKGSALGTAGNVGIGTINPNAPLDIQHFGATQLFPIGGGGYAYSLLNLKQTNGSNNHPVISVGNLASQPVLTFGAGYEGKYGKTFEIRTDISGAGTGGIGYANLGQALVVKRQSLDGSTTSVATMLTAPGDIAIANGYTPPAPANLSNTRLYISSSGNIGVGIANPSVPLDFGASTGLKIGLYNAGTATDFYGFGISSGTLEFYAQGPVSGGPKMVIQNGNVGIGVTSPTEKLTVAGDVRVVSDSDVSTALGSGALYVLNSAGTNGLHIDTNEIQTVGVDLYLNNDNAQATHINNLLHITTGGNVGIGTASPGQKLTVAGDVGITGGFVIGNARTEEVSASGTGDLTIPLGRFKIGSAIHILVKTIGGWAEQGGEYLIAGNWNANPVVLEQKVSSALNDRLRFYGYVDPADPGYAFLFATWDNQSPSESYSNTVRLRITGYDFSTATTGNFASSTQLSIIKKQQSDGFIVYANNTLAIDTATQFVGIRTANPDHPLDVEDGSGNQIFYVNADGTAQLANAAGNWSRLNLKHLEPLAGQSLNLNFYSTAPVVIGSNSAGSGGTRSELQVYGSVKILDGANNVDFLFQPDGSSYLNGGNVGIGTTGPTAKLDIFGNTTAAPTLPNTTTNSSGIFRIKNNNNVVLDIGALNASPWTYWIQVGENGAYAWPLALQPLGGNVGIGTSNPSSLLHVSAGTAGDAILTLEADTDNNNEGDQPGIVFLQDGGLTQAFIGYEGSANFLRVMNRANDSLRLGTNNTDRLVINGGGNVGIGTTSPVAKLSVAGSIFASSTATSTFLGSFVIDNGRFEHNYVSGKTTIATLNTGQLRFEANAGWVPWFDLPVESGVSVGSGQGYTARIDGQDLLTLWARASDSSGVIDRLRVAVGQVSASVLGSANIPSGSLLVANGALCVDNGGAWNCDDTARTAGYIYAESTSITAIDLAENFPVDPQATSTPLAPGMLVAAAPREAEVCVRVAEGEGAPRCLETATSSVPFVRAARRGEGVPLGVVSTKPGVLLGGFGAEELVFYEKVPVALAGRVPVVVNAEGGSIRPGDRITLSSQSGIGTKATTSSYTVGFALSGWEVSSSTPATATTSILLMVDPQFSLVEPHITFAPNGNIGIGTTSPLYEVHIAGAVAAESFVALSSREWKEDIQPLSDELAAIAQDATSSPLALLRALEPKTYRYKGANERHIGFVAEEAPSIVRAADGKGIDLYALSTLTVAALQEVGARVDRLEVRLADLEKKVASLEQTQGATIAGAEGTNGGGVGDVVARALAALKASVAQFVGVRTQALTVGAPERPTGITLYDEVTGEPYCVRIRNGQLVPTPGACDAPERPNATPSPAAPSEEGEAPADTEPPTLTLVGNNPARVRVGETYKDLGVLVDDNVSRNIGYTIFLDGREVREVRIDTSAPAVYHIRYVAVDQAGNQAQIERVVEVYDPNAQATATSSAATAGGSSSAVEQRSEDPQEESPSATESSSATTQVSSPSSTQTQPEGLEDTGDAPQEAQPGEGSGEQDEEVASAPALHETPQTQADPSPQEPAVSGGDTDDPSAPSAGSENESVTP